jgi:hypothetical protein
MKKSLLSIVAFALISLSVVSCGSKSDPKSVAQNFLNALTKMDYEGAKKYGTPETGSMLDMLASFSSMTTDSMKNTAKNVKVEILSVKENGDKCDVTYKNSEKTEEQVLNLVKKDGKWLVNMSKDENMGAGAEAPATDAPIDEAVPMTDSVPVDVKK